MKRIKTNDPNSVDTFINALKNNQIIAYPTDTIYGLGTDINNNKGIDRINSIKMRKQPMSIALGSFEVIKNNINAEDETLIKIEEILKDGKIGFRIPNHDYLKSVLTKYQKPITTTSINETGSVPLYIPDEIEEKFGDKIDLLIDDGIIQNNPSKIFMFEADEAKQIR